MSITPNGSYVFLANSYFQYSTGTASFVVPVDPSGQDPTPVRLGHCLDQ